jgi:hypothetical protein
MELDEIDPEQDFLKSHSVHLNGTGKVKQIFHYNYKGPWPQHEQ